MDTITFKAKYIKPVVVKKHDGRAYRNVKLNLIELEQSDYSTVKELNKYWSAALSDSIITNLRALDINKQRKMEQIFALTEQDCLFELLDPKKIQALTSIHQQPFKQTTKLAYLQVNPKNISATYGSIKEQFIQKINQILYPKYYRPKQTLFKKLGTALLNEIKELSPYDTIEIVSLKKSMTFYLKNGFKITNLKNRTMKWVRK